jgi:hypothetical protein
MNASDVCRLAQNLARNCGYACFPVSEQEAPTRPERDGGHGYKDASKDPDEIAWLWQHWPGPLIGIATGAVSNVVLLDLDVKHDAARAWWQRHGPRMPPTRTYRSRSAGVHFHLRYVPGIGCNNGRDDLLGVDVKGDGGYLIFWFAAGLPCLDHTPPAPWPGWLTEAAFPPPKPAIEQRPYTGPRNTDAAIAGIVRKVAETPEGNRNPVLNWGAFVMGRRVRAGEIGRHEAETLLAEAARAAGLEKAEAARTIRSGLKGAGA